jgi:streptogramin lyase
VVFVGVAVFVAAEDDGDCAVLSDAVDAALCGAVGAIAQSTEPVGPPLTIHKSVASYDIRQSPIFVLEIESVHKARRSCLEDALRGTYSSEEEAVEISVDPAVPQGFCIHTYIPREEGAVWTNKDLGQAAGLQDP